MLVPSFLAVLTLADFGGGRHEGTEPLRADTVPHPWKVA